MPRVAVNSLRKRKSSTRRRRTSNVTRVRFGRTNAASQKRQILSNAKTISSIRRMLPPAIYTDYQYTGGYAPFLLNFDDYFNILSVPLLQPTDWSNVMRQDPNVLESSSTLIKRMQLNLRYTLGESYWCQISTFVVTLRREAANLIVNQGNLNLNEHYITSDETFNPRLNSKIFKVHFVSHRSLMSGAWKQANPDITGLGAPLIGNPRTTMAKGEVNLRLNIRLRQPLGTEWRTMTQNQLQPSNRYFLLTFFKGSTSTADDDPPRVDWDAHYVAYNAS